MDLVFDESEILSFDYVVDDELKDDGLEEEIHKSSPEKKLVDGKSDGARSNSIKNESRNNGGSGNKSDTKSSGSSATGTGNHGRKSASSTGKNTQKSSSDTSFRSKSQKNVLNSTTSKSSTSSSSSKKNSKSSPAAKTKSSSMVSSSKDKTVASSVNETDTKQSGPKNDKEETSKPNEATGNGMVVDAQQIKKTKDSGATGGSSITIYVSNIPQEIKACDLKQLFLKHATVLDAKIIRFNKIPDQCFGKIAVENEVQADNCIANLNKMKLSGNVISLSKQSPLKINKRTENSLLASTPKPTKTRNHSSSNRKEKSDSVKSSGNVKGDSKNDAPPLTTQKKSEAAVSDAPSKSGTSSEKNKDKKKSKEKDAAKPNDPSSSSTPKTKDSKTKTNGTKSSKTDSKSKAEKDGSKRNKDLHSFPRKMEPRINFRSERFSGRKSDKPYRSIPPGGDFFKKQHLNKSREMERILREKLIIDRERKHLEMERFRLEQERIDFIWSQRERLIKEREELERLRAERDELQRLRTETGVLKQPIERGRFSSSPREPPSNRPKRHRSNGPGSTGYVVPRFNNSGDSKTAPNPYKRRALESNVTPEIRRHKAHDRDDRKNIRHLNRDSRGLDNSGGGGSNSSGTRYEEHGGTRNDHSRRHHHQHPRYDSPVHQDEDSHHHGSVGGGKSSNIPSPLIGSSTGRPFPVSKVASPRGPWSGISSAMSSQWMAITSTIGGDDHRRWLPPPPDTAGFVATSSPQPSSGLSMTGSNIDSLIDVFGSKNFTGLSPSMAAVLPSLNSGSNIQFRRF